MEKLRSLQRQSGLVKIITGARRCGKSKLLYLFQTDLQIHNKAADSQIININLEDLLQTREIGLELNSKKMLVGYNKLLDFVLAKLNPDKMNYVFIDEMQLLEDWQQVANTLRLRENVDVYITGSNAYMFSSDLANFFGGRYIEIKMQPFSFKEYITAFHHKEKLKVNTQEGFFNSFDLKKIYDSYVRESSFPQTINLWHDRQLINDYLMDTIYLNTIQKDIVQRFGISDSGKLDAVVRFLFDNIGCETSIRGIERGLKAAGHSVSVATLAVYIQGLLDSYLMYKCDRYDIKGKQLLNANSKYYVCDIGLRTALLGNEEADMGRALENIVYLELLRRGYRVYVGNVKMKYIKTDNKTERKNIEVDFVAQKPGGEIEYYQVALYILASEETLRRELASLEEIDDNYSKFLLTMDPGNGVNKGIKRLNVLEWLADIEGAYPH
jgi:hypothetical protein